MKNIKINKACDTWALFVDQVSNEEYGKPWSLCTIEERKHLAMIPLYLKGNKFDYIQWIIHKPNASKEEIKNRLEALIERAQLSKKQNVN